MQLRNYLQGFEPRQPQIALNMAIIPLVNAEIIYEGIAGAENIRLAHDTSYDSLHLEPIEAKLTIVPNGFTYLTKEKAQDRAVAEVGVFNHTHKVRAYCVQSSQGGHMKQARAPERTVRLLPMIIRQYAHQIKPQKGGYSSLWHKLREMNQQMGVNGDYLVSFFNKFTQELNEFVAQFEPIPHQRGAITIINDRVVGVDILPSPKSFLAIWEILIRDCYGSSALMMQDSYRFSSVAQLENVNHVNSLLQAVNRMIERERNWAFGIARSVMNQSVVEGEHQRDRSSSSSVTITDFVSEELEGEVVLDDNKCAIYLSAFRTKIAPQKVPSFTI